jgi:hypothetical protein
MKKRSVITEIRCNRGWYNRGRLYRVLTQKQATKESIMLYGHFLNIVSLVDELHRIPGKTQHAAKE